MTMKTSTFVMNMRGLCDDLETVIANHTEDTWHDAFLDVLIKHDVVVELRGLTFD